MPTPSRTTSCCRPRARSTSSAASATRWSRPGIPVEFSKGEAGVGQHEINITYGGALEVADRHLVFKNGVKEIASGFGRAATFMAKWSMDTRRVVVPHPHQPVGRRPPARR